MKHPLYSYIARYLAAALLAANLVGCDSDSASSAEAQPVALQGIWEHNGYGTIYQVDERGGTVYQYTRASCLISEFANNQEIAEFFAGAELSQDGTALTLSQQISAPFATTLTKSTSLPAPCADELLIKQATPTVTFEHFAQSFADYYAFFEQRGVDWNSRVASARTQLNDDMSDAALFDLMSELIAPLDDGHVQLEGNGNTYRPAVAVGANPALEAAFTQQSTYSDIQQYANVISQKYWHNIEQYLDEGSVEVFDGAIPDRVIWATIGDGAVGYLYIASMAYLSDSEQGLDQTANVAIMDSVMAAAMADLANTQAIIIDLRKNTGGHDAVSRVVAGYFTEHTQFYGSKHARSYLGDSARVNAYVEPRGTTAYLNPVAIITGVETASAAESFTLAMKARPQVTLVGENTNGILSDVLEKTLPNGWNFWLSNEVYYDHLGAVHEVEGITPDVAASVFSIPAIEAGYNPAIDAALGALGR